METNNLKSDEIVIIGYSGHSYVCIDVAKKRGLGIIGYCDNKLKENNPYNLEYIGQEMSEDALGLIKKNNYFIAIGNNTVRYNIAEKLIKKLDGQFPASLIDPSSVVSLAASISNKGVLINVGAIVNSLANIKEGVILNSSCVIEHECSIGKYSHIGPGAVLAGNVQVGEFCFIGANSVVKQGVKIGNCVTVGAGSVVIRDIPDGVTVAGNPSKIIK